MFPREILVSPSEKYIELKVLVFPVFEAMVPLPRFMASSLLACQDLAKDTMAMQYRAKANHD